jgi:hypothetical protein
MFRMNATALYRVIVAVAAHKVQQELKEQQALRVEEQAHKDLLVFKEQQVHKDLLDQV